MADTTTGAAEGAASFVEEGLASLDPSLQTFLVLDALVVGASQKDQDETLFRALSEGGRLPRGMRGAGQAAELRRRLVQQGVPYGDGFSEWGMAPSLRFALSSLAGDDEGACAVLERLGNLNGGYAFSPALMALSQAGAMYANRERDFEILYAQDPDSPLRMAQLRLARPPAEWGEDRRPAILAAAAGDAVRSFFHAGELSPLLDLAAWGVCGGGAPAGSGLAGMRPLERAVLHLWHGDRDAMAQAIAEEPQARGDWRTWFLEALDRFLRCEETGELPARAVRLWAKSQRTRRRLASGAPGLWQAAASFAGEGLAFGTLRAEIEEAASSSQGGVFACWSGTPGFKALLALDCLRTGARARGAALLAEDAPGRAAFGDLNCASKLLRLAALKRFGGAEAEGLADEIALWCGRTRALPVLQALFAGLAGEGELPGYARSPGPEGESLRRFDQLVAGEDDWQMRLEALEAIAVEEGRPEAPPPQDRRLLWAVDSALKTLSPLEQSRGARGWNRPRPVSLRRLLEQAGTWTWLAPCDRRLAALAAGAPAGAGLALDGCCELIEGMETLRLREEDGTLVPVAFKRGRMVLRLEDAEGGGLRLAVEGVDPGARDRGLPDVVYAREDGPGGECTVRWFRPSVRERQMAGIVGAGMDLPREACARAMALAGEGSPFALRAELAALEAEADPAPVLLIEPAGSGYAARVGVMPLGRAGTPFYPAGEGPADVLAALPAAPQDRPQADGAPGPCAVRARRSFQAELAALAALEAACPALGAGMEDRVWRCQDAEGMLELLAQLAASGLAARPFWPRGGEVRLCGVLRPGDAALRARAMDGKGGRFSLAGEVLPPEASGAGPLALEALLAEPGERRFAALGEGRYAALDDGLRWRLACLAALTDGGRSPLCFGRLAAGGVAEAAEGMRLEADGAFLEAAEAGRRALEAEPAPPSGLMADLADCQREGCRFIQRLALRGAGGWLCDEPGLGKGVQAVAGMLALAGRGPCLLVCPDCAMAAWERALARFAPDLEARRIGQAAAGKTQPAPGPGDVLVAGWSRLAWAGRCLAGQRPALAVFDGARRLSMEPLRKAALDLGADCALVLGAAPREDSPELVWDVLSVAAPGLFGSRGAFLGVFGQARPGGAAAKLLRKLAGPFVLRRTLAEAAEELPGRRRFERTVLVDPSPEERERCAQAGLAAQELAGQKASPSRRRRLAGLLREAVGACRAGGSGAPGQPSRLAMLAELAAECADAGLAVAAACGEEALGPAQAALEDAGLACLRLGPEQAGDAGASGNAPSGGAPGRVASGSAASAVLLAATAEQALEALGRADLAPCGRPRAVILLDLLEALPPDALEGFEPGQPVQHVQPLQSGAPARPRSEGSAPAEPAAGELPPAFLRLALAGTPEERLLDLPEDRREPVLALLGGRDPGARRLPDAEIFALLGAEAAG